MYFESIATPSVEDAPPGIEHILEYRPDCTNPRFIFVVGDVAFIPQLQCFSLHLLFPKMFCSYFTIDASSTKLIPTFALTPENAAGTELKSAFKALKIFIQYIDL
jgi:hypothetical protein